MQKEIIICVIIIIAIVTLNIFTQTYTKESVEMINQELNQLQEKILEVIEEKEAKQEVSEEKVGEVQEKTSNILKQWHDRYEVLAYFIEHDELEKVETELTSLKGNIEVEEYEQGIPDLKKCAFILEHIKNKFSMQFKNIF